ncbi:MAG: IS1634 family transposase [Bacteroidota bacterium]|nr:IS1634 family transposase [Bacteroidota bacterium]
MDLGFFFDNLRILRDPIYRNDDTPPKNDDTTHQPNWDVLREFLEKTDFIYIADCKLCSLANLSHIHAHGGKFITVIPSSVSEHKTFLKNIISGKESIEWTDTYIGENQRDANEPNIFRVSEGEKSRDGYRIIWVHGSFKDKTQKRMRSKQIGKAKQELKKIQNGLNKRNLRSRSGIEKKINQVTKSVKELITIDLTEENIPVEKHSGKGRPLKNALPVECKQVVKFTLNWTLDNNELEKIERADGLYPLITNTDLEPIEVLKNYKNQAYLEKRFYNAKSILEVAPVFLKSPKRIEAIIFLYFIALMIIGLVERHLRATMKRQEIKALPIRPSKMKTKNPTWKSLSWFFRNIQLFIMRDGDLVKDSIVKGVTPLHRQIIGLLGVPETLYDGIKDGWWNFATDSQTI